VKNAAWCYRFAVILEDEQSTMPVLIADYEAVSPRFTFGSLADPQERFLPPLPPISSSTSPNDIRKTDIQIAGVNKRVIDILQGATMNGIRPRWWIDWTVQSSIVRAPKGHVGLKGEKGIVVYKAFGMTAT
jgi:hypothetical protein